MNGFGFIEYKDAMDARDVVPGRLPLPPPPGIAREPLLTRAPLSSFPYVRALTPTPLNPQSSWTSVLWLISNTLKTDPTSWENVSRSSSRAAPARVNPRPAAADTATTAATRRLGRAAPHIACRSLDSPVIPAGRSVKAFVFHGHHMDTPS
jgi:hypothetical protein